MKYIFNLVAALIFFSFSPAIPQPHFIEKPVRITPEGRLFQQPVWSPDGKWIAVTGPYYAGIYIVRPDGKDFKQITADAAVGFKMSWSPDGSFILGRAARWERRRRYNSIKVYDISTGEAKQISDERTFMPAIPVWAAGNDRVFLKANQGLEIFRVPVPSGKRMHSGQDRPQVLQSSQGIEVLTAEGKVRQILKPVQGRYLNVSLSPDDSQIVFEVLGGQLYVCNLDGTGVVNLGRGERPVWAPNRQWILFMVTEDDGHRMLGSDIYAIRVDGTARTNLTQTRNRFEMNPVWSPDGKRIAFDDEKTGGIYIAKIAW